MFVNHSGNKLGLFNKKWQCLQTYHQGTKSGNSYKLLEKLWAVFLNQQIVLKNEHILIRFFRRKHLPIKDLHV